VAVTPIFFASDPNLEHYLCKLYHFFFHSAQTLGNTSSEKGGHNI